MNWDIISYGSGDFLRLVFTGIASIFGNNDYSAAMQTTALLGFFVALFASAFSRDMVGNFKNLIGMIVLFMLIIVPKVNVIITDRITPANSSVVANVPIGLAATASFFSFTGDWLARSFETVFAMPNEVKYTTNGMLFANKLIDANRRMELPDDRQNNNFLEFFTSCVVVDGIGHNRFSWRDVMDSDNLGTFFANNVAVNAASFKYTNPGGAESIEPCRAGWVTIRDEMLGTYQQIIKYGLEGGMLGRFDSEANAQLKLENEMQAALNYLTGNNQTAQTTVVQHAIHTGMGSGMNRFTQETGAMEYIVSGAEFSRLNTYQAVGDIASEKLPLLRNLFEAFIYAIFPIIVLMAIVFPTKVPIAYATALVWINLWAPMYAVLHFAMSYYSQAAMSDIVTLYGGGYSVFAVADMAKLNADVVATTGYLGASLPILAWMLVSRSGALAASFAGRVIDGYDKSAEKGADEVLKGQGTRDGVDWRKTDSGGIQQTSLLDSGSLLTQTGGNGNILEQKSSSLMVDAKQMERNTEAARQTYDQSVDNVTQQQSALTTTTTSTLQDSNAVMETLRQDVGSRQDFQSSESVMQSQNFQTMETKFDEWATSNNVQYTEEEKARIYASLEGQLQAKTGTPFEDLVGSGVSASITTKAGWQGDQTWKDSSSETYQAAERFAESNQFSEATQTMGSAVSTLASSYSTGGSDTAVEQLNASINEQEQAQTSYTNAVNDRESASRSLQAMEERSTLFSVDNQQALLDTMATSYQMTDPTVNSQEAAIMADETIRRAAAGDQEAMNDIKYAISQVSATYNGSEIENFDKIEDAISNTGAQNVNGTYTGGRTEVVRDFDENNDIVNQSTPITRQEVEQNAQDATNRYNQGRNNTDNLIGDGLDANAATREIEAQRNELNENGEPIADRVDLTINAAENNSNIPTQDQIDNPPGKPMTGGSVLYDSGEIQNYQDEVELRKNPPEPQFPPKPEKGE